MNDDYTALTSGAGSFHRPEAELLAVTGEDRERFLNGQVTCEVKGLAPGHGVYGFFTTPQGKVTADLRVLAAEDAFLLELPAGKRAEVVARLDRYRIADRVDWSPLDDVTVLTVAGPRCAEVVPEAPAAAWAHREVEVGGARVRLVRDDLLGVEALDLWVPAAAATEVAAALRRAGAVEVTPATIDAVRVERGAPRFGVDFADHFPQETGLEAKGVSYSKGCYLGQEVVARIHYRGGVNRGLRGVVYDGGEGAPGPAPGTVLLHGGRPAGSAGTVAFSPALGRTAGLAVLHQRAAEPGTVLEVEGGGSAEVRALPLVGAADG
ncbi:MAG TPA: glycine cleavage T C-terminal barrel domain-containing protein [Thermoanaerobaculia bacterium]|nr:glycine cleavage T C-terminal barrel domain-containing protein [Thermoanaerobaculia bacterium]